MHILIVAWTYPCLHISSNKIFSHARIHRHAQYMHTLSLLDVSVEKVYTRGLKINT